jgi:hypothetical protein
MVDVLRRKAGNGQLTSKHEERMLGGECVVGRGEGKGAKEAAKARAHIIT